MSKKLEKNKNMKSSMSDRRVYFSDLGHLLTDGAEATIEDIRGFQFCCNCAGTENEDECECVKRKEKRGGKKEWFMSAGQLSLDEACEKVVAMANKIIEILREESFVCECSPLKTKEIIKIN